MSETQLFAFRSIANIPSPQPPPMILSLPKNALAAIALCSMATLAAKQPNVVFILSDDQAWSDYGFMGHPHLETPHLDQLASESLVYERGYVSAPLCRPSLASLATGLHPHQHSIRGNDPVLPGGANREQAPELYAAWRPKMSEPIAKLPSVVKELANTGYLTLQVGKWWEGDPKEHGFTHAMSHGITEKGGRHGDEGLEIGRSTQQPYYDFVDEAVAKNQPFFVWYAIFLPHTPHDARESLHQKYKDKANSESEARYWANIEWFDEACGEVLDYLDQKGIADNTIVIYSCDNGWVSDPQRPERFIRSKREPYEAGIRTPIMIRQPGVITPARDTSVLASNIDIPTTILRACGIEPPATMAGLDLRDPAALASRNQVVVEAYQHDSHLDQRHDLDADLTARVLIQGWDKIIDWRDHEKQLELYDLQTDLSDRHDLRAADPQKAEAMARALEAWLHNTVKPLQP